MRRSLAALCLLLGLQSGSVAHEVPENRAIIKIHPQIVYLTLHIHASDWTERYAVHELDDVILSGTTLRINQTPLAMKLRRIEKESHHYVIEYTSINALAPKIRHAALTLPGQLGDMVMTVVRAETKYAKEGKRVDFAF